MKTIKEMISLKGRRALITGAVGGIGRQMAMAIAELDGDLVLVDKPSSDYGDLTASIQNFSDVTVESID